jgi:hypothetical protein
VLVAGLVGGAVGGAAHATSDSSPAPAMARARGPMERCKVVRKVSLPDAVRVAENPFAAVVGGFTGVLT